MKKTLFIALAACAIAFAGCKAVSEPEPVAVESVTLNATTLTLAPGATGKLTATVTPDNVDDKKVVWLSSDLAVATVDENGTVTARKEGTANITAHAGGKTATCALTVKEAAVTQPPVKPEPVAVESVKLNAETLTIEPGKTKTLAATVTPDNADDKTVAWSSSNSEVATVGEDGTVTAVGIGEATITARAGDKEAKCRVTVKQILVAVQSVTLNATTLTLTRGETGKLTATVLPENADDKTVLWSSSDTSVATVDNDGTVTAHKAGEAKITAQAGDIKAECAITVNPILVESVALDQKTLTLTRGETGKLTATVLPENADDTTVTWSSSDTSVATVGNDGTVTAVSKGTATITAQAGGIKAECAVIVHTHTIQGGNTCTECGIVLEDFKIYSGSVLTEYKGNAATVYIPDGVTSIGYDAFYGCTSLTSVTIPASVTSIGSSAFSSCSSLASVTIPEGVTSIEDWAFYGCTSLASVEIPASVTSIGSSAFKGCTNLASVEIPDGVTSIGSEAFYGCTSLASVEIPDGVTSIGSEAFEGCTGLTSVTIPDGVASIGSNAFRACDSLASVTIPDSVTYIGRSAFEGCESLASVTIPGSVTYIGDMAFYDCTSLASVTYGGTFAQWCALNNDWSLMYEKTVTVEGTDLKQAATLVIPDGVTRIGSYAFYGCKNLTSVTIPASVTSIGDSAFYGCDGLTSVEIPDGVTSIGDSAFYGCDGLTSVEISDSVTSIGRSAFYYCTSLASVTYAGTKDEWGDIQRGSWIFSDTKAKITGKDGVTFTVDYNGNITE